MRLYSLQCTRLAIALWLGMCFSACGVDDSSGSGLTVKFINVGELSITGLFFQEPGKVQEGDWSASSWGDDYLPVASLEQMQFVFLKDFERVDVDAMVEIPTGTPTNLRWEVPAAWIPDAEYLTVSAGLNEDGSWSTGHQFGLETAAGETNVTP